jgi:outer membrane receptor protein involved in Fe transport
MYQLRTEYPLNEALEFKAYLNHSRLEDWERGDWSNGVSAPKHIGDPVYVASFGEYGPTEYWGAKGLLNWKIGNHVITPGVEWRRREFWYATWVGDKAFKVGYHDSTQDIYSAFLEGTFNWGKWEVMPSLRFDSWSTDVTFSSPETETVPYNGPGTTAGNTVTIHPYSETVDETDSSIDPKLRVAYHLTDEIKLRCAVGRTFRAPSPYEKYNYSFSSVQLYATNANLDPEQVTSVEVGADMIFLNGKLLLNTTFFYNQARNRIEMAPDAKLDNTKVFQNLDSDAYGMEFTAKAFLIEGLWFSMNAALTSSEYDGGPFDGESVPMVPDYKVYTALDYRWGAFSAHVGVDFIGERTITIDPTVTGAWPKVVKADSYALVDASLRYDLKLSDDLTLFFKLWGKNLLDQEYMVDSFFVYLEPRGGANFEPLSQGATYYFTVGFDF